MEYVVNFGSIENFSTMLDSYYKSEGGFSYFYAPEKTAPWWLSLISPLILIVLFVLFWVFLSSKPKAEAAASHELRQKPSSFDE